MSKSPAWVLQPATPLPCRVARRLLAFALRRAGAWLAALSRRLHPAEPPEDAASAFVEFHAEAGAPEGALFVDGVRVATLPGVTRL